MEQVLNNTVIKKISKQRRWQLKMQKQKRCTICGKERYSTSLCKKCLVKCRKKNRIKYGLNSKTKSGKGRPFYKRDT